MYLHNVACRETKAFFRPVIALSISEQSEPDSRIIAKADSPMGVDNATIVSVASIILSYFLTKAP